MAEFNFVEAKEKIAEAINDLTENEYFAGWHDGMCTLFVKFIEFRDSRDNEHCETCKIIGENIQDFIDRMKEMFPELKDVKNA